MERPHTRDVAPAVGRGDDRREADEALADTVALDRVAPPTLEDAMEIAAGILQRGLAGKRDAERACQAAAFVLSCAHVLQRRETADAGT